MLNMWKSHPKHVSYFQFWDKDSLFNESPPNYDNDYYGNSLIHYDGLQCLDEGVDHLFERIAGLTFEQSVLTARTGQEVNIHNHKHIRLGK